MVMRAAIRRGLALSDFENMTVGMILDYLVTCSNLEQEDEEPEGPRQATQADFDNF
jgi:hypothetical protein